MIAGKNAEITSNTDTEIIFTCPFVEAGTHEIEIYIDGEKTYPKIKASTPFSFWGSLIRRVGSINGMYQKYHGNGFSSDASKWAITLSCPNEPIVYIK